jgi:NAD(P)H-dependent FMN reductase
MTALLDVLDRADGIILASPVNFFTVTALTKRFVERLVCGAYWPWGKMAPALRATHPRRPALLVSSCAMPALLARLVTNVLRVLKSAAAALGARPVGSLIVGLAARSEHQPLSARTRRRARRLGRKLITALNSGN